MNIFKTKGKENKDGAKPVGKFRFKSTLPICIALILIAVVTIGGTIAFLQERSGTVSNTFSDGQITYTLRLNANARPVNHNDNEVTMPSELLSDQSSTNLSVAFTANQAPALDGYSFDGWYYDENCTLLHTAYPGTAITVSYGDNHDSNSDANKVNISLYAKWTANTDTAYKVEHYQQNTDDDDYTLLESEDLTGTTDTEVTPAVKSYVGFTSPSAATVKILGNGSTVVRYKYDRISYTVTLTSDNGIDTLVGAGSYRYGKAVEISATVKNGYTWEGWTGTASASTEAHSFSMPAENVSYRANTAPITYTISYNLYGGAAANNPASYTVETESFTLTPPSRLGYTFAGWLGTELNSAAVSVSIPQGSIGNREYSATWTANNYKINFNANGGSGAMAAQTFVYDTAENLSANAFTKVGYTFNGWNTAANGSGTAYGDGASVLNLASENNAEITLYAQWIANTYNVAFSANGGSGTMAAQTFAYDTAQPLSANTFTKNGHSFNVWNTAADGSGTAYADKATVLNLTAANGDTVTLYAQWISREYTVKFSANGGSGIMAAQTFVYDIAENLSVNTFTKVGYTFNGWNTAADGSGTAYGDGASVLNLASESNGEVTLYAQWIANTYTVEFSANGGSGTMATQNFVYDTAQNLPANTFTRDGYGFTGWNTMADGTGVAYENAASVKNLTATNDAVLTLYAQWVSQEYTISFNANGGSGSMASVGATYDADVTLPSNTFTRIGFKFIGWNTNANGTGRAYSDGATVRNVPAPDGSNAVLYAQWEELKTVTLIYDANGGTNAPAAQSVYVDIDKTSSHTFTITNAIPTYVSPGGISHTFLGWSEDPARTALIQYSADGTTIEDPNATLATSITVECADTDITKTLYAVWGVTYHLSYNAGSGSGVPESKEYFDRLVGHTFDVDYSVKPEWAEHEFRYWTTNVHYITGEEKDGSVMYPEPSEGNTTKITISPDYSDITLYARYYNKGALQVVYHPNTPPNGTYSNMPDPASITGSVEAETISYEISSQTNPTIKLNGTGTAYNLLGWASSPDAFDPEYKKGDVVYLSRYNDQATTLYAVWDVMQIVVCMDINVNESNYNIKNSRYNEDGIQIQNTDHGDAWTEDYYYWNNKCITWAPRSAAENPTSISAAFYISYINTRSDQTFIGFSSSPDSTVCDVYNRVTVSTGQLAGFIGAKTFNLTQEMWDNRSYDPETNAWFIPIYAVKDRFVRVTVKLNYNKPGSSDALSVISSTYNCHVASIFESGDVSAKFFYKNGNIYKSEGAWLYMSNLRDGSEYQMIGWAWDPNATVPDGAVSDSDGQTPVYVKGGSAYIHLRYDREMFINVNDENLQKTVDSQGVTCYAYNTYIVYEKVTDPNTFKILLDYNDGVDQVANGGFQAAVTPNASYTYLGSTTDDLFHDCDFSKCLNSDAYEIVGWSLSKDDLKLDLTQYPIGHPKNRSSAQEAIFATNPPLTVSTEDAYDEEGNFYYKRFYAVYAKTLQFDGNYQGTVRNVPSAVSAYTHYDFEGDVAYITIPSNIPTRDEALFLGWSTTEDGAVEYAPGDTISVTESSKTLYAVWQKAYSFTLEYDWNYDGGSQYATEPYSNTVSHINIQIIQSEPTRDGYIFLGWAEDPNATVPQYSSTAQNGTLATITVIATVPNEPTTKTLYAVWSASASPSSLDGNGEDITNAEPITDDAAPPPEENDLPNPNA